MKNCLDLMFQALKIPIKAVSIGSNQIFLSSPFPSTPIFLSHSGNEKAFVEQLCEDLKRMNHFPFFDQDSDSLPKGERFASLIIPAAEQCLLVVVVLSEGYLTSKWPMLELSTFVKSMKGGNPSLKLLPFFYKLLPGDLSAENVETKWKESWKKLVEEGKVSAEGIALWSDAVRELRAWNGLEFRKYGTSEAKYRAAVVEEICSNVPPMLKYKTDDIRGYDRLCEIRGRMSFIDIASSDMEVKDHKWRVSFIATLHGILPLEVERKVKELQQKSLIYEASPTLETHDLYTDFAQSLVIKVGSREREWWVHFKNSAVGMDLGLMKRLCLDGGEAKILYNPQQVHQCEKLECLVMIGCHTPENYTLHVGCLKSLCVLILKNIRGVVEIQCSCKGWTWMGDEE